MKKDFSQLTPEELLEVKKNYLLERDEKADLTHADEEVSDEQAGELYEDPDYLTLDDIVQAMVVAYEKYPWGTELKGTFIRNADGTRTFAYVPTKK